jgi:hypothetical protein
VITSAPALAKPLDHEMAVEDSAPAVDELADRGDDQRPDRDRGHEMAVHDVDVHHASPGIHHRVHLVGQSREVAGQERRRDLAGRDRQLAHSRSSKALRASEL